MQRSRLSRTQENKSKKTFYFSLFGIVIILILLLKFGLPLLINFSLFLSNRNASPTQTTSNNNSLQFIAPPVLLQTFTATNTAQIAVNGTATAKENVKLFVNTQQVDQTTVDDTGKFSFDNVSLQEGDNTIFAKTQKDNKDSDSSNTLIISYKKSAPSLTIDAPSDGQSLSKQNNDQTPVSGKTNPDATVTVNGYQAIVDDNGNYSYTITLSNGDNHIHVEAMDTAGNKTTKDITVKYSQ